MTNLHPSETICNDVIGKETKWNEYKCAMSELSELHDVCEKPKPKSGCEELQSCHEIILRKVKIEDKSKDSNLGVLTLIWNSPRVSYLEDFVSYDYHNFIGEVGGFMGLFLGFSFTSIFGLYDWIKNKYQRS